MEGETIKSFLVGLGFDIDESSLTKFTKSIATASLKVAALGTAIEATASAVVYGISDISTSFEKMGYEYRLIAPAINKALVLRRELLRAYSNAGLNIGKVIQSSVRLNLSLAKTGFAFKALYDSVGSRFFSLITKQSDIFREKLYKNMPKIQAILESFIKFIFKAFEAINQLGSRLYEIFIPIYDFLVKLDEKTGHWSTIIFALIAAWKLLNLEFLATPLGLLLSLGAAILLLYDDLKTFEEGGKAFFNWGPAIPVLKALTIILETIKKELSDIFQIGFAIVDMFFKLAHADFTGAFTAMKLGAQSLGNVLQGEQQRSLDLINIFKSLGQFGSEAFGSGAPNLNSLPGSNLPSYLFRPGSQTNQNVNSQTSINITGAPMSNADRIGNAVAGSMNAVNFGLVKNMQGLVQAGGHN